MNNLPAEPDGGDSPVSARERSLRRSLRASEARFRNVIEAIADGVIVVRDDGVIVFANPAATVLLARDSADLVGRVFGIPIVAGATTEIDVPRSGGESRVAELRVVQTEWEEVPALLASLRDVTERKRLEDELRRQADQLAEADRRKDQFLAMLAHELRNPLAPILSAAHLMRLRDDDPEMIARMRDVVEQQASHIARLVDDLLDASRFARGKVQVRKESLNLAEVVVRAVETARSLAESSGRTLSTTVSEDPLWVQADPTRITQVMGNLIDNAVKYTDHGGRIAVSAKRQGNQAVITVRDNGIGISSAMLPHIFELFAQADSSLDRSRGGLGIGLTLVHNLVALHGGSVTASSPGPGQGSEFVVKLPIAIERAGVSELDSPAPSRPPSRSLRVLIVDDNKFAADSLASLLEMSGHRACVAYHGRQAIESVSVGTFEPECVLLDIGLPEMDGFEVAGRLRELPGMSEVVMVAITGYGHEEAIQKSASAGIQHHLIKPVDFDALLAVLSLSAGADRRNDRARHSSTAPGTYDR